MHKMPQENAFDLVKTIFKNNGIIDEITNREGRTINDLVDSALKDEPAVFQSLRNNDGLYLKYTIALSKEGGDSQRIHYIELTTDPSTDNPEIKIEFGDDHKLRKDVYYRTETFHGPHFENSDHSKKPISKGDDFYQAFLIIDSCYLEHY